MDHSLASSCLPALSATDAFLTQAARASPLPHPLLHISTEREPRSPRSTKTNPNPSLILVEQKRPSVCRNVFPELVLLGQVPVEREEPRDVEDGDDLGRRGGGKLRQRMEVFDEAHFGPGRRFLLPDLVAAGVVCLSAAAPHPPYLESALLLQGVTAAASDRCQPKQMKGREVSQLSFLAMWTS